MSRSRKKNPAGGNAVCASEKSDKRIWHKRLRAAFRTRGEEVHYREVSDPWCMGKDGKAYYGNDCAERDPSVIRK